MLEPKTIDPDQLAELYAGGMGIAGISEQTGISRESVRKTLHRNGVELRASNRAGLAPEEAERIQELHAQGMTYAAIGREVGRNNATVRKHLVQLHPELIPAPPTTSPPIQAPAPPGVLEEEVSYWRSHAEHYRQRAHRLERRRAADAATARARLNPKARREDPVATSVLRRLADSLHDEAEAIDAEAKAKLRRQNEALMPSPFQPTEREEA
ncbi:helix-turn-helix domain-containing protein [Arthrobacter rhombi]|uniref:helix-turn-helix domain-containing protein n=1 Tax=Arthrobacter rhombi TaxID=71253 RepID=UPI003FCF4806